MVNRLLALPLMLVMMLGPRSHRLEDVYGSIKHIAQSGMHCTMASVGPGRWLGAEHCKAVVKFEDGSDLYDVKIDPDSDLRLVSGPIAPPIPISRTEPELGEPVTIWGWTDEQALVMQFVVPKPLVFFGHAQLLNSSMRFEEDGKLYTRNWFHEGGGPGVSGGPILNEKGELVGVAEALIINPSISVISPTVKDIRKFLGEK